MEEYYQAIEEKIAASGYQGKVSGEEIYNDICDQMDGKENGEYVMLSKREDGTLFEYHITILEEEFNLGILKITAPDGEYVIDFDAE